MEPKPSEPIPVLVVGSCNFDLTIQTDRLPGASETLLGSDYHTYPGGKGANQALGLARLGFPVRFLARVGKDHYGAEILEHLARQGSRSATSPPTPRRRPAWR